MTQAIIEEPTIEVPAAIEGEILPKTDATFVACRQANGRINSLFGTSAEWKDALPADVLQHVKSLPNEELFPMGEKALRDIADNLVILAEIRDRFYQAKGPLMGYANWKEFVAKNSAYSIRTIQRRLNEATGTKDETKVNDRYKAEAPAVSEPEPEPADIDTPEVSDVEPANFTGNPEVPYTVSGPADLPVIESEPTKPDINVIAAELIRDIESAARQEKLKTIIHSRNRLNPTIRKNLISALANTAKDAADFKEQLETDFVDFPTNGKAHQRLIRDRNAEQPEPDLDQKLKLAASMDNATVKEIDYDTAKNLILANEWLGNMGTTRYAFGLFFGPHLAGVVCFGDTAGTNVKSSICGSEHADKVATLCRGACLPWAHPHSASYLISEACRQMTKKGYNIFVAYSDPEAGEIGTVYQASNWLYCGMTNATEKFKTPDGKIRDARHVHLLTRDRTNGTLKYKRTRAEQKALLLADGCEFFKGNAKHRYVGIYGNKGEKRILRKALKWNVLPYPKRTAVPTAEPSPVHTKSVEPSESLPA